MEKENFDLILTGLQSDDTGMGQTGALVGEMLGFSTATLAVETNLENNNKIKIKRELESGWFQWITMPLPASISIQSGLNSPRYPSLKGIMGAKKKDIKTVDFDLQNETLQNIDTISIPNTSKQTEIIDCDTDQAVDRIVNILKSEIKVL